MSFAHRLHDAIEDEQDGEALKLRNPAVARAEKERVSGPSLSRMSPRRPAWGFGRGPVRVKPRPGHAISGDADTDKGIRTANLRPHKHCGWKKCPMCGG